MEAVINDSIPQTPQTFSSMEKWMITITVMLVAVIEVLDVTIVNVSLNQMMGSFGATSEEITWILTAYLVSSAIFMPLTGVLMQYFGCRKLLLINIVGFLIASMLCGASTDLAEIVFCRILQGIFGASLVPISQYVLRNTFPREEQGKAMAIWGMGIMVAPIMGPTLGGYITEVLNWRWVFYINVPVCVLAFVMAINFIRETPTHKEKIDWLGLILMAIAVGTFQTVLDQGNNKSWFESDYIVVLSFICVVFFTLFIYRGWSKKDNIINLHLFAERHFMASTLILSIYVMGLFGSAVIQPLMMQLLMNYSPSLAGDVMAPRGLASALVMFLAIPLNKILDNRILVAVGILISAYGTYMMTQFTMNDDMMTFIIPGIVQGVGLGLVMMPLSSAAFDYLKKNQIAEASGLFSFGRSMGISIGISILSTVLTRLTQTNWNTLSPHIQVFNPNFTHWMNTQNLTLQNPAAMQLAAIQVQQQSSMIAFLDCFRVATIMLLLLLPIVLLLKKPQLKDS